MGSQETIKTIYDSTGYLFLFFTTRKTEIIFTRYNQNRSSLTNKLSLAGTTFGQNSVMSKFEEGDTEGQKQASR